MIPEFGEALKKLIEQYLPTSSLREMVEALEEEIALLEEGEFDEEGPEAA
jgi:predicted ATP-grasp superfamily ATP-dependent carboligase